MTAQPSAGRSYPISRRCSGETASGSLSGASGSPTPAAANSCGQWLVLTPRTNASRRCAGVSAVAGWGCAHVYGAEDERRKGGRETSALQLLRCDQAYQFSL